MSAREILTRERERKRKKQEERERRRGRRVLRLPAVMEKTGPRRSQIYDGIAGGIFPKPVPISVRAVGWLEDELDDWLEARIAARDSGTAERSLPGQRRGEVRSS